MKFSSLEFSSLVWEGVADAVVCICLREREDRFREACAEFHRVGLCDRVVFYRPDRPSQQEYEDFCAQLPKLGGIALTLGSYGCWRSHQVVCRWALDKGLKRLLVLEDDVFFLPDVAPDQIRTLAKEIKNPDHSWDFWHLGYFALTGFPLSRNVWWVKALSTVAYIANTQGMLKIVGAQIDLPIDSWIMNHGAQLATYPKLAWQRPSPTNVEERWFQRDVTAAKEAANKLYRKNIRFFDLVVLVLLPLIILVAALILLTALARRFTHQPVALSKPSVAEFIE